MSLRVSPVAALIVLVFAASCSDADGAATGDSRDTPDADDSADATLDTSEVDGPPPIEPPPIDLAVVPPAGAVVAGIAEKPADLVRGLKAEGQVGDFVLANQRARFLVEGLRPTGGYRSFGGLLVDADLQPGGEDRFSEVWLVWNLRAFKPHLISVVSDGRDGTAVVRADGRTVPYAWVQAFLGDLLIVDPIDIAIAYEYRLAPDSDSLELQVTLYNDTADRADLRLPAVATNMGDGAPAFTPGPGLANIAGGTAWQWTGGVGLTRGYGFIPEKGIAPVALFQETNVQISQLPAFMLEPGESRVLTFHIVVTGGGTSAIEAERARFHGIAMATVAGHVTGETPWADQEGEDLPSHTAGRSWVALTREADVLALTPVEADGSWSALVPPGEVLVQAFAPARGASAQVAAMASAEGATTVDLELPALGEVIARVRDPEGGFIPAQVAFFRVDAPSPLAPEPVRFDPDWGRGRSLVAFQTESQVVAHLLPGTYTAVASRGYSWEIAQTPLTVAPGTTQTLELVLEKAVDDAGWSAADMHLHGFWSPDSEVPYPLRLRQAAANDVSLPFFTEHTYMGDLAAPQAAVDLGAWVSAVPGQEVSTEYGHFGAFPLRYDAAMPSGGAVFEHGWAGTGIFDAMRHQHDGPIVVQVNHPRDSTRIKSYFNSIGLDTETLEAERPERWTLDWDTLEVFNGGCGGGENEASRADWYNFNNRGLKKTLSSGSDSHTEADGIGQPRTWIEVSREAVAADHEAIVAPLLARRAFVSCGPFVRFTAGAVAMGGMTRADAAGEVRFQVRVEAPSWMTVDSVRLLENGVPVAEVALATWPRPEGLKAAVRFDGELVGRPSADAWYVVEVVGSGGLWPIEPSNDPYALTNPIDVDHDGDGEWTAPVVP